MLWLSLLVFYPGISHVSDLPKESLLLVGMSVLVALLGAGMTLWRITRFKLPLSMGTCLPVILLLMGAVSVLWAHNQHLASLHVQKWTATLLLFYFIIAGRLQPRHLILMLGGFTLGVTVNALVGLAQVWGGQMPGWMVNGPGGTFVNKNVAAQVTVLALPLAIGGACCLPRRSLAVLAWVCSLVLAIFLFHTYTRAAWLAAAIALSFMLGGMYWCRKRQGAGSASGKRIQWVGVVLWVALFCLGANLTAEGFRWEFGRALADVSLAQKLDTSGDALLDAADGGFDQSASLRLGTWRNALVLLRDSGPFGVGEGNFQVAFPPYANAVVLTPYDTHSYYLRYLHNEYLEFAIEYGLPGVVAVLLFCLSLGYASWRAIRVPEASRACLALVVCASLLALGVNAVFSSPLFWPLPRFVFALLAGTIFVLAPMKHYTWQLPGGRLVGGLVLVLAALLAGAGFTRYVREVQGQEALYEAMAYFERGDVLMAERTCKEALELVPHNQKLRMFYGALNLSEGNSVHALEQMEALAKDHPYDLRNNQNRVIAYEQLGLGDELMETYELMLAVRPYDRPTAEKLAALYQRQGDEGRAEATLTALSEAEERLK